MYRFALAVTCLLISSSFLFPPWEPAHAAEIAPAMSLDPSITFTGGSAPHRATVIAAIARFTEAGLELPDLDIYLHDDRTDCLGYQGYFQPQGTKGVIHLCFPGEFLALHELGHAWEHFNLDDPARDRFQALTGASTWDAHDVAWGRRASEISANTMAHGLLSTPLESADIRTREFDRFEALTDIVTPRLAEIVSDDESKELLTDDERNRAAALAEWRSTSAAA